MVNVETFRITLTYRIVDLLEVCLMEVYTKYINTIVFDTCLECISWIDCIISQRGGVLLYVTRLPCVFECLVDSIAYINRVSEYIRLVHREGQNYGTVATVYTWHRVTVDTRCPKRIAVGGICAIRFLPGMIP